MTDKNKPQDNDQKSADKNIIPEKALIKTQEKNKDAIKSTKAKPSIKPSKPSLSDEASENKRSKTAISALLLSIISVAGVGAHFYWQTLQSQQLAQELLQNNQNNNNQIQSQVQKALTAQKQSLFVQMTKLITEKQSENIKKIAQLENSVARLSQNKPSDWLIHEAEYLVRVAARTMWLERDTQAAIGLLNDADNRLTELNSPIFLPVRQLIHQDIEQLRLMPTLESEKTILALMGLNQQIDSLPLTIVDVQNKSKAVQSITLSTDIADWQDNLAKSWRKFLETFVVIHSRDGTLKPLLSPNQQENLRENLRLKLQQAQWAAQKEKNAIYQQTLNDIQGWLEQYFDVTDKKTQGFINEIERLKMQTISYDYPSTLSSLQAMRTLIEQQKSGNYTSSAVSHSMTAIPLPISENKLLNAEGNSENLDEKLTPKITIEDQLHQGELKQRSLDTETKIKNERKTQLIEGKKETSTGDEI